MGVLAFRVVVLSWGAHENEAFGPHVRDAPPVVVAPNPPTTRHPPLPHRALACSDPRAFRCRLGLRVCPGPQSPSNRGSTAGERARSPAMSRYLEYSDPKAHLGHVARTFKDPPKALRAPPGAAPPRARSPPPDGSWSRSPPPLICSTGNYFVAGSSAASLGPAAEMGAPAEVGGPHGARLGTGVVQITQTSGGPSCGPQLLVSRPVFRTPARGAPPGWRDGVALHQLAPHRAPSLALSAGLAPEPLPLSGLRRPPAETWKPVMAGSPSLPFSPAARPWAGFAMNATSDRNGRSVARDRTAAVGPRPTSVSRRLPARGLCDSGIRRERGRPEAHPGPTTLRAPCSRARLCNRERPSRVIL